MTSRGLEYEVTWIPIKNLSVIWRKSQRAYDEKWARKIADEFDPDKFEPVVVTKPNGSGIYHIIEGQHRKGGAEMAFGANQQVPCKIVGEADPARAAEIWLGINEGRKAPKPVAGFLVAVEAKRELEIGINSIVRRAGYHVGDNTKQENCISAVGALRKIYVNCGPDVLLYTLQTCRVLWGSDPRGAAGKIITGLGMFLNEFHSHLDVGHLRKVITGQYRSPGNFVEAARLESEKSSEPMDVAMSELIRMKYNKGQREAKKLKRKEA